MSRLLPISRVLGRPAVAACAALALAALIPAAAQSRSPRLPEPTDAGTFEGTWARLDPVNQQLLHVRRGPEGRGWQLRLRWRTSRGFEVDTGWSATASFEHKGHPGSIALRIDPERSDERRIVAAWSRRQEGARGSLLEESGETTLYRTSLDGRQLVWSQPALRRVVTVEQPMLPEEIDVPPRTVSQSWVFEKQSVRQLEWDEVYW